VYDATGRAIGVATETLDALGRVVATAYDLGPSLKPQGSRTTYEYDAAGRRSPKHGEDRGSVDGGDNVSDP
jgi:YD repeat-containing protein